MRTFIILIGLLLVGCEAIPDQAYLCQSAAVKTQ